MNTAVNATDDGSAGRGLGVAGYARRARRPRLRAPSWPTAATRSELRAPGSAPPAGRSRLGAPTYPSK
jgi:hypothetical protein